MRVPRPLLVPVLLACFSVGPSHAAPPAQRQQGSRTVVRSAHHDGVTFKKSSAVAAGSAEAARSTAPHGVVAGTIRAGVPNAAAGHQGIHPAVIGGVAKYDARKGATLGGPPTTRKH